MKQLKSILFWLLDNALAWFTPAWRRNSRETIAALNRFTNYNLHSLDTEKLELCAEHKEKLQAALLRWDKEECNRLIKLVDVQCSPMPGFKRNAVVEMVESFFVIMVIFLGLRTYYVQPFRIPTGSMQPSLNGIIVHPVEEIPSWGKQAWDMLTLGSSYVEAKAEADITLRDITERPKYLLFTETILKFSDGSEVSIPSAQGAVLQYLKSQGKYIDSPNGARLASFKKGETIVRARVDAGDMILVNRLAYHFRKPERGETFVFDTRGINTSMQQVFSLRMNDQTNGTHYIKRLCGLPGDKLQIIKPEKAGSPTLLINDKVPEEATIARVSTGTEPYNKEGYQGVPAGGYMKVFMTDKAPVYLQTPANPNLHEYVALGDNTTNSLDSRYWGPVHQFNIIGPASFTLWPFTSHWGTID